mmetsp:Transcript_20273/g.62998  ORF Transcript_20273/g.62998 Transcript_20273/m.62998 type:complete len:231 (-) Transcript_20273:1077-1769(-)
MPDRPRHRALQDVEALVRAGELEQHDGTQHSVDRVEVERQLAELLELRQPRRVRAQVLFAALRPEDGARGEREPEPRVVHHERDREEDGVQDRQDVPCVGEVRGALLRQLVVLAEVLDEAVDREDDHQAEQDVDDDPPRLPAAAERADVVPRHEAAAGRHLDRQPHVQERRRGCRVRDEIERGEPQRQRLGEPRLAGLVHELVRRGGVGVHGDLDYVPAAVVRAEATGDA